MGFSDCGYVGQPGWSVNAPLCNCLEGKSKVCRTKLCFYCKLFFVLNFRHKEGQSLRVKQRER